MTDPVNFPLEDFDVEVPKFEVKAPEFLIKHSQIAHYGYQSEVSPFPSGLGWKRWEGKKDPVSVGGC
jgi:hypothetical protein